MRYGIALVVSLLCLTAIAVNPAFPEDSRGPAVTIQAEGRAAHG